MGRASQVLAQSLPLVTAAVSIVTTAIVLYHLSQVKAMRKRQDALEEELKHNISLTELIFKRFRGDLQDLEQKLSTSSSGGSDLESKADLPQESEKASTDEERSNWYRQIAFTFTPLNLRWWWRAAGRKHRDRSLFAGAGAALDEVSKSTNPGQTVPRSGGIEDHSLCSDCMFRLTSGSFRTEKMGFINGTRSLGLSYKVKRSKMVEQAAIGCTLCSIISNTMKEVEEFELKAKAAGATNDKCYGMLDVLGKRDIFAIWLDFIGTNQYTTTLQIEIQNEEGESILGPQFSVCVESDATPFDGVTNLAPITDVSSPEAFGQIRTWIRECDKHHILCSGTDHKTLPTRILDVDLAGQSSVLKLVESHGSVGDYVALSYCWGSAQHLTLTQKNYSHISSKGILLDGLPQTLIDAVYITRQLGIQYLWIDSLCIIQDSHSDKQREIHRIGDVYKNSFVTISAASSPAVSVGFLHARPRFQLEPLKMPIRLTINDEVTNVLLFDKADLPNPSDENDPVDRRGWTFQENVLSRRVIIYGSSYLRWVCRSLPKELGYDNVLQGSFLTSFQDLHGVRSTNDEKHMLELYNGWNQAIFQFSKRSLTFPEDNLRAVAGIASEFANALHDTYVAGLWKGDLIRGILWHTSMSTEDDLKPRSLRYVAPTWSWASHQNPVTFPGPQGSENLDDIFIEECSITLADNTSPFGDILDGHLRIRAPCRDGRVYFRGDRKSQTGIGDVDYITPGKRRLRGGAQLDALGDLERDQSLLMDEHDWTLVVCLKMTRREGLLLKEVQTKKYNPSTRNLKTFRRVGYFCLMDSEANWLNECVPEEVIII